MVTGAPARLVYLASPYSDPDPAVKEQRFADVCRPLNPGLPGVEGGNLRKEMTFGPALFLLDERSTVAAYS